MLRISSGASFMFGRCLTSTAWGIAADRIGRKPVVMFGIFSVLATFRLHLYEGVVIQRGNETQT